MPLTIKGTSAGGFTVKGTSAGASNIINYLPSQETGVFLWIRADLGVTLRSGTNFVSAWANQGTGGGTFTQGNNDRQPTWNATGVAGWPSITWVRDGSTVTSDSMRMAQSASSINVGLNDYTFFFACNPYHTESTSFVGNDSGLWFMDSYDAAAGATQNRLVLAQADVGGNGARLAYFTANNGAYAGRVLGTTGAQIVTFELKSGGTTNANIYRNGSAIATGLNYSVQQSIDDVTNINSGIGLGASNSTNPAGSFSGEMYEVIGVKTTDSAMRARVTSYLGNRYGVAVV